VGHESCLAVSSKSDTKALRVWVLRQEYK
jgi:hypothetical protein